MKSILLALAILLTCAPIFAQDAAPTPTEAQRISGFEAYLQNGDPTAALKDKDGNIPKGLTTAAVGVPGPGHNAWMMTSTALVLFMTLPGLALFYGGLVRRKNILSVCAQCLACSGLVTILWWAFGYSLVFGTNFNSPFLGGSEYFFMKNITSAPNTNYSFWVSENVFSMYQLMFAIITPALIVGAIAERMKFSAIMTFIGVWMFLIYFPMAHMVWGASGLMNGTWNGGAAQGATAVDGTVLTYAMAKIRAIDFAGGTVVHMTSGWSALILCIILGKRLGFGKDKMAPHSMVLCMVGTGMLWVGWYGFNAGSAVAADGIAANAFTTTTLAAATAGFVWAMLEGIFKGHPSILGFCSGIVAGLVVITPACGFVNPTGAMIIGLFAAVIPFIFVVYVKNAFGYDDALDTFGVHAIGGTLGAILTGILANGVSNPNLTEANAVAKADGLATIVANHSLIFEQFKAIGLTLALSIVGTVIIAFAVKITLGLRPTREVENAGLDISEHGEEGYVL